MSVLENGELKWDITVRVMGIKRKCRKIESHSFGMGMIDNNGTPDVEHWKDRARDYVASNMKQVTGKIQLNFYYTKFQQMDGFVSKTVQMFDPKHISVIVESPVIDALNA